MGEIELSTPAKVRQVVFSRDREGQYRDRLLRIVEVQLSMDGQNWQTACRVEGQVPPQPQYVEYTPPVILPSQPSWDALLPMRSSASATPGVASTAAIICRHSASSVQHSLAACRIGDGLHGWMRRSACWCNWRTCCSGWQRKDSMSQPSNSSAANCGVDSRTQRRTPMMLPPNRSIWTRDWSSGS